MFHIYFWIGLQDLWIMFQKKMPHLDEITTLQV